jgi:hypothetical protein
MAVDIKTTFFFEFDPVYPARLPAFRKNMLCPSSILKMEAVCLSKSFVTARLHGVNHR